jgi:hypothetical protein
MDVDSLCEKILNVASQDKQSDENKQDRVIGEIIDPSILWKEIDTRRAFFSTETVFEGGLKVNALIEPTATYANFQNYWATKVPASLRRIRNHLVHGREARQSETIHPTSENEDKLNPWFDLISSIAKQLIVHNR